MSKEISNNLRRLARRLFEGSTEQEQFLAAVISGEHKHHVLLWMQKAQENPFSPVTKPSWAPDFVQEVSWEQSPGSHPLHAAGAYYVMDASSAFAASALQSLAREELDVLDMCAAPGGKSIFAWRLLKPRFLLCNEKVSKRCAALISNLTRCAVHDAAVVSSDPSWFGENLSTAFDVVIVDAPCSGQSLIAKGDDSPGCFHPATINMNSNRQKKIIANSSKSVAPEGSLLYVTCTYAKEENEEVVTWFLKRFPDFEAQEVPALQEFQSAYAKFPCYRMWPHLHKGAGAFVCLLKSRASGRKSICSASALPYLLWRNPVAAVA